MQSDAIGVMYKVCNVEKIFWILLSIFTLCNYK